MALKKVKKQMESGNTNNGLNELFPVYTNNTYNSPISYFNKNNDEINYDNEDVEEIEEVNNEEPMKYESKDDISPIKRSSKTDEELKKFLKVKRKERKVLTIGDYEGSVVDVCIEEVKYLKSEKYLRAKVCLQLINDVPLEFVPINLFANLNLNNNSKLSRIIRGITGKDAGNEFDLNVLKGKKVSVRIKHITDKCGNIIHAVDTIQKMDY